MKMYIKISIISLLVFFSFREAKCDEFIAQKTTLPFTIDGIASETAWDSAVWYPMKYVWLPYESHVDSSDFTGRFKLSWTSERLYLLVEIVDDILSDRYPEPLDNYYNDDCVEVFLDENKSGGEHNSSVNAFNAFAMHVSTKFNVVDNGKSGTALFDDLINANLTKNDSLYIWELEIKVYPDTYDPVSPGEPITLTPNKVMGFSLAYCDNDGGLYRENFLASTYVAPADSNSSWLNASIFGTLTLVDSSYVAPSNVNAKGEKNPFCIFPNPVKDELIYKSVKELDNNSTIKIIDLTGHVVYKTGIPSTQKSGKISMGSLNKGIYIVEFTTGSNTYSNKILLQ